MSQEAGEPRGSGSLLIGSILYQGRFSMSRYSRGNLALIAISREVLWQEDFPQKKAAFAISVFLESEDPVAQSEWKIFFKKNKTWCAFQKAKKPTVFGHFCIVCLMQIKNGRSGLGALCPSNLHSKCRKFFVNFVAHLCTHMLM